MPLGSQLKALIGFLTVLPLSGDLTEAARGFRWAPLVGLLRGLLVGGVVVASLALWGSPGVAASLGVAAHLLVQGLHHFDGLVDAGEAVIASRAGRDAVAILRDRHRGGFAIGVGGVFLLVLWSSVENLASSLGRGMEEALLITLAWGEAASCFFMYLALLVLPGPPYKGLGALFKRWATPGGALLSFGLTLLIGVGGVLFVFREMVVEFVAGGLVGGFLLSLASAWAARVGIGFVNGDVAGMVGELGYLGVLLGVALVL